MTEICKIGESFGNVRPAFFELVLDDIIEFVNPADYDLKDETGICPKHYYITSGDAIEKAKILEKDIIAYISRLQEKVLMAYENEYLVGREKAVEYYTAKKSLPSKILQYLEAYIDAKTGARRLIDELVKAKGEYCFMETEWENHSLHVIPKNPRNKSKEL